MQIVELDMMDGKGKVSVAVSNDKDADRLRLFMQDVKKAFEFYPNEEAAYYDELNRGYAKDRM